MEMALLSTRYSRYLNSEVFRDALSLGDAGEQLCFTLGVSRIQHLG